MDPEGTDPINRSIPWEIHAMMTFLEFWKEEEMGAFLEKRDH